MKFSRLQIIIVLLLAIGISNHVLLIPHIIQAAKRDAWICILIGLIIMLLWGYFLALIIKKNKQEKLYIWVRKRTNKTISNFITFLFLLYIGISGIIIFHHFIQSVNIYFLPLTPTWLVMIPFLALCVGAAYKDLKTIVYMSIILLPIVWILGHFVAITTMTEKSYSYLFPIMTQGNESLLQGIVIFLGASVDIIIILILLQQHTKKPYSFLSIAILTTILTGLALGPTIGSIASFGPNVAAQLRFPAFEQWRLVMLGEHFSHLDFLAVFQLLCGVLIRAAVFLFLIYDILETSAVVKKTIFIVYAFILGTVTLLPISDIWIQTLQLYYFYPALFIFGVAITFVLLIISYLPSKKGVESKL